MKIFHPKHKLHCHSHLPEGKGFLSNKVKVSVNVIIIWASRTWKLGGPTCNARRGRRAKGSSLRPPVTSKTSRVIPTETETVARWETMSKIICKMALSSDWRSVCVFYFLSFYHLNFKHVSDAGLSTEWVLNWYMCFEVWFKVSFVFTVINCAMYHFDIFNIVANITKALLFIFTNIEGCKSIT